MKTKIDGIECSFENGVMTVYAPVGMTGKQLADWKQKNLIEITRNKVATKSVNQ